MHAKGCTVSVADHVNFLSVLGGVKNPNLDPRLALSATIAYWQMRGSRFLHRFFG
jgi:hypothetical protein